MMSFAKMIVTCLTPIIALVPSETLTSRKITFPSHTPIIFYGVRFVKCLNDYFSRAFFISGGTPSYRLKVHVPVGSLLAVNSFAGVV